MTQDVRLLSDEKTNAVSGKRRKVLLAASVASMIGQFNMQNIRLLQDMGYEVHVACNFREGNTCDGAAVRCLRDKLTAMHVGIHQWDCPRGLCRLGRCVRAYIQIWRLTGQYVFDFVHCHSPIGGALVRTAAHRRGIFIIYTVHGFHFYRGAPVKNWLLYYPIEKLLSYWTDILVTVNKEDFLFAKKNLRAKRISRIPGIGVDTTKFALKDAKRGTQFRRKYQIPQDAVLFLSVGELNQNKNHRVVLEALAGLQQANVYYMICGQGILREWLTEYAKVLHISRHVCIPGYVEDIVTAYQASDVFILPSKREGLPVALMEAMAAGLPCLVSDIRGCRELISHCGGIRFGQEESGALTCRMAVRQMLKWKKESVQKVCDMGAYNQKRIRQYDSRIVQYQMEHIYQKAVLGGWER